MNTYHDDIDDGGITWPVVVGDINNASRLNNTSLDAYNGFCSTGNKFCSNSSNNNNGYLCWQNVVKS